VDSSFRVSASIESIKVLVDGVYADFVAKHPFMGISVGVITPDGTGFFNYGYQNLSAPAVTEDTIYSINSMTKVFTGICLARAIIEGQSKKLTLDSLVQPYYTGHLLPEDSGKSIMFKDLATHWSGLERTPDNWAAPDADDPYATYTDELFFEYISNYTYTDLHIRRQYLYSNAAFGLLAYVLSNDMGHSDFGGMMSRAILEPLKMTTSGLIIDSKDMKNLAVGHDVDGACRPWGWSCETVLGSWAVRSSARDMTRFLAANIEASEDKEDAPVLLQAMAMSHKALRPTDTDGYQIGLGWRIEDFTGTRTKSGSGDGQESNMYFHGKKGLGLVVLSNSYIDAPHDIDTTSAYIFKQMLEQAMETAGVAALM